MKSLTPMQAASWVGRQSPRRWAALPLTYTPNLTDLFMTARASGRP